MRYFSGQYKTKRRVGLWVVHFCYRGLSKFDAFIFYLGWEVIVCNVVRKAQRRAIYNFFSSFLSVYIWALSDRKNISFRTTDCLD